MRLRLSLPYSEADHIKTLVLILLVYRLDVRHLPATWSAPRRPEIKKYVFAFAYIVGKLNLRIFRLRGYAAGLTYYRIDRKVYERLAFCCGDSCVKTFLQSSNIFSFKHFRRHSRDYLTCLLIFNETAEIHENLHSNFIVRVFLRRIEIESDVFLHEITVICLCLCRICRKGVHHLTIFLHHSVMGLFICLYLFFWRLTACHHYKCRKRK